MQITPNAPEDGANVKLEPNQKNEMYISASDHTNETPLLPPKKPPMGNSNNKNQLSPSSA